MNGDLIHDSFNTICTATEYTFCIHQHGEYAILRLSKPFRLHVFEHLYCSCCYFILFDFISINAHASNRWQRELCMFLFHPRVYPTKNGNNLVRKLFGTCEQHYQPKKSHISSQRKRKTQNQPTKQTNKKFNASNFLCVGACMYVYIYPALDFFSVCYLFLNNNHSSVKKYGTK